MAYMAGIISALLLILRPDFRKMSRAHHGPPYCVLRGVLSGVLAGYKC